MANEGRGNKILNFIAGNSVGVAIVVAVLMLIIPMPKFLIDITMIINIALAIIMLLVVIYTPRASEFQTFPRFILFQTIFGLGINISSTRLILSSDAIADGSGYIRGQSAIVQGFSNIVAGNNIVIGIVIFFLIIIVQMVVVTKGAGRISEVSARFTLDSMSNKFFDIQERLNLGSITPEEAEHLKDAIRKEIDFYSAMDGASKFVSGNVKVGIVITIVNLIAGFIIGMVMRNMDFQTALKTYSMLTIGDGLTSQIPSIIISIATGMLVTGSKTDEPLDKQIVDNFARDGHVYEIAGAVLIVMAFIFRHQTQFFLIPIGAFLIFCGYRLSSNNAKKEKAKKVEEEAAKNPTPASNADSGPAMLDPLSLELGYGLIPLVDPEKGAELLERISRIRTEARYDMGFEIPKIRIQDNMVLNRDQYSFKIDGIEAGQASVKYGYLMCMDTGTVTEPLDGEKTKDPAFGMDAIWLPESRREEAEAAGYVVVDTPTVISTHLTEIIRSHAAQMLDTQAVSVILDKVKESYPVLVDEVLNTAKISYRTILSVMQNLLEEKVSIRNYKKILETMANYATGRNIWDLTAKVREALGLQICMQYVDPQDRKLRVMRLSQELTDMIAEHAVYPQDGSKPYVGFDPVNRRRWIQAISTSLAEVSQAGFMPIILCVSPIRQLVKSSIEREQPGVVVLSDMEVMAAGSDVTVEIINEIEDEVIQEQVI